MQSLTERYELIRELGSGGMGTVFLARSLSLGTLWAIKRIPKSSSDSFDLLAEPNILKNLSHPALPRIVDIDTDDEYVYVIEDYFTGDTLEKLLQERHVFDEATVVNWACQLCNVLIYLHSVKPNPIIYRDMKPGNIIIGDDNTVRLIDFGIAREYKTGSGGDTTYMGTRGYAAPEQYGTSQTDARTDIYSLGVTLYHLLTGKSPNEPPYELKPLREISRDFSEGIEYIVKKCTQTNPDNRYSSAAELLRDLTSIYAFNSGYRRAQLRNKFKAFIKAALLIGFALLIHTGAGTITKERESEYAGYLDTGLEHLQAGEFESALESFEYAIKLEPRSESAYLGVAWVFFEKGDYDDCRDYLEKLCLTLPEMESDGQLNYMLGSICFQEEDYLGAIRHLELATGSPERTEVYMRDLAVSYAKTGDTASARDILERVQFNDSVSNYISGQIYTASEDFEQAAECFEAVISHSSDPLLKKRGFLELANVYKLTRHTAEGALARQIDTLERAVRELDEEDDIVITESMAEAYFTAQNYSTALDKFQKLLDLGYNRAYIYRNIAIINQQIGDFAAAEQVLHTMRERYPGDYRSYLQLSYLYIELEGERPESERDYTSAAENYELAVKYAPGGASNTDLQPLSALLTELREKGWLD